MSRRTLKDHLTQHYAGESLPSNTASRLQALANTDLGRSDPVKLNRDAGGWWLRFSALAAGFAVIVSGTVLYVVLRQAPGRPIAGGTRQNQAASPLHPNGHEGAVVPMLVAVKFQAEGCPYAAAVEPVFRELADKYGDKPIVFAKFDMTSQSTLHQSRNLACVLGIDWIYEGPHQSGMIKLVDRQRREVLATLTDREQMPEMENMLARAFP